MDPFFILIFLRNFSYFPRMKMIKFILPALVTFTLFSCTGTEFTERTPVLPKGSEESQMPWNIPQAGEGGGALGGALGQQGR